MSYTYVKPARTMMEAFDSLPEGTMAQLIHNQIYISPAPTDSHQEVLGEIFSQLHQFVKKNNLGKVRVSPYDVYLNPENIFQPDILFIANENLDKRKTNGFYGAPDLVIEILSPATRRFDKGEKKNEYERSGVKEYWMVDPADKSTEGFFLEGSEFKSLLGGKGEIELKLLGAKIRF